MSQQPGSRSFSLLPSAAPPLKAAAAAALCAVVAAMIVGCGARAAATPPPTPPPAPPHQDAQSRYEPRSQPGAGQALLAKFAGDWDVVKTFHPMKGDAVRTAGECRQRMIHDGRFLESSFTFFDKDRGKTTGTGISGFDPKSGRFTTVWFDSRQTTMSMRQSEGTFDGKEIVLYAASLDGEKASHRSITRTRLENDGQVLMHRHYLVQDDGKERLMMELRLTRRASMPAAPGGP